MVVTGLILNHNVLDVTNLVTRHRNIHASGLVAIELFIAQTC